MGTRHLNISCAPQPTPLHEEPRGTPRPPLRESAAGVNPYIVVEPSSVDEARPGEAEGRYRAMPWTSFCHYVTFRRRAILIDHDIAWNPDRTLRKRPWRLRDARRLGYIGRVLTLARAVDVAERLLTEMGHVAPAPDEAELIFRAYPVTDGVRYALLRRTQPSVQVHASSIRASQPMDVAREIEAALDQASRYADLHGYRIVEA